MTSFENVKRRAETDAKSHGYFLNPDPDFLQNLLEGLKENEDRYGYASCPCRLASGNFEWDRDYYMDVIWPQVAEKVPAFDTARLIRGWAGLYAMNRVDGNAIIGCFGDIKGFYGAVGFSGHGLQQAPAVGKCLSELIQFGK